MVSRWCVNQRVWFKSHPRQRCFFCHLIGAAGPNECFCGPAFAGPPESGPGPDWVETDRIRWDRVGSNQIFLIGSGPRGLKGLLGSSERAWVL